MSLWRYCFPNSLAATPPPYFQIAPTLSQFEAFARNQLASAQTCAVQVEDAVKAAIPPIVLEAWDKCLRYVAEASGGALQHCLYFAIGGAVRTLKLAAGVVVSEATSTAVEAEAAARRCFLDGGSTANATTVQRCVVTTLTALGVLSVPQLAAVESSCVVPTVGAFASIAAKVIGRAKACAAEVVAALPAGANTEQILAVFGAGSSAVGGGVAAAARCATPAVGMRVLASVGGGSASAIANSANEAVAQVTSCLSQELSAAVNTALRALNQSEAAINTALTGATGAISKGRACVEPLVRTGVAEASTEVASVVATAEKCGEAVLSLARALGSTTITAGGLVNTLRGTQTVPTPDAATTSSSATALIGKLASTVLGGCAKPLVGLKSLSDGGAAVGACVKSRMIAAASPSAAGIARIEAAVGCVRTAAVGAFASAKALAESQYAAGSRCARAVLSLPAQLDFSGLVALLQAFLDRALSGVASLSGRKLLGGEMAPENTRLRLRRLHVHRLEGGRSGYDNKQTAEAAGKQPAAVTVAAEVVVDVIGAGAEEGEKGEKGEEQGVVNDEADMELASWGVGHRPAVVGTYDPSPFSRPRLPQTAAAVTIVASPPWSRRRELAADPISSSNTVADKACLGRLLALDVAGSLGCLVGSLRSLSGLARPVCEDLLSMGADTLQLKWNSTSIAEEMWEDRESVAKVLAVVFATGIALAAGVIFILGRHAEKLVRATMVCTLVNLGVLGILNAVIGNIPGSVIALLVLLWKLFYFWWIRNEVAFACEILRTSMLATRGRPLPFVFALATLVMQAMWCVVAFGAWYKLQAHMSSFGAVLIVLTFFWALEVGRGVLTLTISGTVTKWYVPMCVCVCVVDEEEAEIN